VHLDDRDADRGDRIADGVGVVGVGARVYDDGVLLRSRGVKRIDNGAFAVELFAANLDAEIFRGGRNEIVDVGESLRSVDLGLAIAQQVQIGTVQD
jgi:hypothetical protein